MSENTRDTIEKNLIQNILVLQEIKKEPDYKNSLNYVKVSRKISELIWLLFDAVFASENSDIYDFCDEVPEKIKFIINNFVPKDEKNAYDLYFQTLIRK